MILKQYKQLKPVGKLDDRSRIFQDFIENRLVINTSELTYILDLDKILYIKAKSNYSEIVLLDKSSIISSKTLKYYEKALIKNSFLRVHSSYLINLLQIKGIVRKSIYTIVLNNDIKIPVSRTFKAKLSTFL